jgi:glycosyltransferase involved in cell wall biosynthesis
LSRQGQVVKIIFNCHIPFMMAHGGQQIQIEQTKAALEQLGLSVEPLRWWDDKQTGDVLHQFARVPMYLLEMAHEKGMKVVTSAFLSAPGARPRWVRLVHKLGLRVLRPTAPKLIRDIFSWDSYRLSEACIAMTPYEASLLTGIQGVPPSRVHVIPNGVEEIFLRSPAVPRGPWLVCTAAIIELKQVLKLAQMAVQAETPLWIIGKPYSETSDYAKQFLQYARQNSRIVRYEGPIADRARLAGIYREARGFVLLSKWESLSLSALEAAACRCPLLLSDLRWAHETFKTAASYCGANASVSESAAVLRRFYDVAPSLDPPPMPMSWLDVARQLKALYESLLPEQA